MKKLKDLILRLKNFELVIFEAIKTALEDNEHIVVEMNSEDQLFEKGITRTGEFIGDYAPYRPFTIEVKRLKGQPTDRVTLRDEEDFHRSFELILHEDSFEIIATDRKTKELMFKYGEEILGLTDENFRDLARYYIAPQILKAIKNI